MSGPNNAVAPSTDTIFERLLTPWVEAIAAATTPVREAPIDLWATDSVSHAAPLIPVLAADSIQMTLEDGRMTAAAEHKVLTP